MTQWPSSGSQRRKTSRDRILLDKTNQTQQVKKKKKCMKYGNNGISTVSCFVVCTFALHVTFCLLDLPAKVYCCQIRVRGVQGTNLSSSGSDWEPKSSRLSSRDKHHAPGQDTWIKGPVTIQFAEQEPTRRSLTLDCLQGASDHSEVGNTPPPLLDSDLLLTRH